jgi:hypothetical protein
LIGHFHCDLHDAVNVAPGRQVWQGDRDRALTFRQTKDKPLLFVPVLTVNTRRPTTVIAERREDLTLEDSTANTFSIEDWSAAILSLLIHRERLPSPAAIEAHNYPAVA